MITNKCSKTILKVVYWVIISIAKFYIYIWLSLTDFIKPHINYININSLESENIILFVYVFVVY